MWNDLTTPVVIAHRGDKLHGPENTLAAFRLAAENGAAAIEFDAKLTRDGEVIILHDQTVDRTTDGSGKYQQLTFAQLRQLDAGSWFSAQFAGEKLPTLEEVFEDVGRRVHMNIELTNYTTPGDALVPRVVELIKRHALQHQVLFSSFYAHNLRHARRLLPEVPCGLLAWSGWMGFPARSWGWRSGYAALHPHLADTDGGLVERLHAAGRRLNVWTVNSEAEMGFMIRLGVDGIITDDPQLARRLIGRGP